jgi:hypothetical protein
MNDVGRLIWEGREDGPHPDWGYAPAHAAFIAAQIGAPSSVEPLLAVADGDEGNDWLDEGMRWFPTAFPPDSIDLFLSYVLHEQSHWYHRAACADGVVWAAGLRPELRGKVASALAEAIGSGDYDDGEMITWLVQAGMRTGEPSVREQCRAAYGRGKVDSWTVGSFESLAQEGADWFLDHRPVHLTTERYFAESATRSCWQDAPWPPGAADLPKPSAAARRKEKRRQRKLSRRKNRRK